MGLWEGEDMTLDELPMRVCTSCYIEELEHIKENYDLQRLMYEYLMKHTTLDVFHITTKDDCVLCK